MRVMSCTRPGHGLDLSHSLFYLTLLLWTRRMSGLADFSTYLSRIITSHSAQACDGEPLRLHCPRHSTISIQTAFYGSGAARPCGSDPEPPLGALNRSCSAFTALQKLMSECQSQRDCQLPVNHLLFGQDPCPGTAKYLHVDYKCKPTEHKRHVVCEGETMILRCKPPKVLIIYAAVYGRSLGQPYTCPSHLTRPPPFECLNHEAVHRVSESCSSKHKCAVAVSNQTLRDPCFPGTRKYLSVVYSCVVPQPLLRDIFRPTSPPTADTENEHPERAALLFTSSVCVGLMLMLLAVSVRVTCRGRRPRDDRLKAATRSQAVKEEEEEEDEEEDDGDEGTESSLISAAERKEMYGWEEVTYVSEAAEQAERIERREMIMQEIWMNAYLNGSSS
ncbi:Protein eva-1 C [Liparis tanakae]|uniref:Protein eva-1 C n=1 Tax=Liparis tanakae TaxID=230148 RepID=A0A4Z2G511_9TELE|nr:Protein eva-1 C [Liparis tanakae]